MRKNGKKLAATLLASVMVFSMVGCGDSGADASADSSADTSTEAETDAAAAEDTEAEGTESAEAEDGAYNMTFIMPTRNEFNTAMEDGMKEYCEANGVTLVSQDANQDSSKLLQYVETAKNQGDDAIVVLPIDSETIPQIVESAGDMKVVIVNRAPADMSVFSGDVAYVGSNEHEAGSYQGEYVAKVLQEKGEKVAKPIFLLGTVGAENTTARTESAKEAMEEAGLEVEVVNELGAKWERSDALTMIQPLITTSDYNCIIANNDAMALGAVEALTAAGIDPKTVPVVGIDATVDGLQGVADGSLAMTVFQDAVGQGAGSVAAAVNMLEGSENIAEGTDYLVDEENSNVVWIPFQPVYADNVADYQ